MDAEPRTPRPLTIAVLVGLLCLIWGSTWLVIQEGLADLPPLTSAAARFGVAFLVVAALTPWLAKREGGARPPFWLWATVSVTNYAGSFGIVYICETVLPSGLVSVLWAVFPLFVAALGHFLLENERLHARQLLGFLLGFLGVATLFVTDLQGLGAAAVPFAVLLLVSPLIAAVGNVLLKRYASSMSSVLLNRNALGSGALLLAAGALLFERDEPIRWTSSAIASVAYLSTVGTVVTFTTYYWLLRHARANRLALIAFVTPPIALVLGWAIGGEPITLYTLLGTATIVTGISLVVLSRKPQRHGDTGLRHPQRVDVDRQKRVV